MVGQELIEAVRAAWGERPRRVLVTGASGFIGSRLCLALAEAGHEVRGMGRNPYRVPLVEAVDFQRGDLRDADRVAQVCEGRELVYHCGAYRAPWGPLSAMREVNVDGTQHVIDACRRHEVGRLVHVSTSAVFFDLRDRLAVTDEAPLANPFSCNYARSKAEAERLVASAAADGLNAITIRARAVFGPGDNALLPRIIEAARRGQLRRLGKGRNRIDLTYIDNLLLALALAAGRGPAGAFCTVTNDEPVELWPVLEKLLTEMGVDGKLRGVPYRVADLAAAAGETLHRVRRARGEPRLTRYTVGLLAKSQTFDIRQTKHRLGYEPIVSMEEGLRRTIAHQTAEVSEASAKPRSDASAKQSAAEAVRGSSPATTVQLQLFTTGYTPQKLHRVEHGAPREPVRIHASVGLIEHPREGLILFDTGYAPRVDDASRRWPYRAYRHLAPAVTDPRLAAVEQLRQRGFEPRDVRLILLSHFHADHVAGLADFPDTDVLADEEAWQVSRDRSGVGALRRGVLPELIPDTLRGRLHTLTMFHGPRLGPFLQTHDVFGDGSIRLLRIPGHAAGQLAALLQTSEGRVLLAADAAWTARTLRNALPLTFAFRQIAASTRDAKDTRDRLHQLVTKHPDILLRPTHCTEAAADYGFDEQLAELGIE